MINPRFDLETNRPYHNDYERTKWYDSLVDPETEEILEEGTPLKARYLNNMEDGIYGAYNRLVDSEKELRRLRSKFDLKDRTDSEYTYLDTFDGTDPINMVMDKAIAYLDAPVKTGDTVLNIATLSTFKVGTVVTLCDGVASTDVTVAKVEPGKLTVSAVKGEFARGAVVARSNARTDEVLQQLTPARLGSHTIKITQL